MGNKYGLVAIWTLRRNYNSIVNKFCLICIPFYQTPEQMSHFQNELNWKQLQCTCTMIHEFERIRALKKQSCDARMTSNLKNNDRQLEGN